MLSDRSLRLHLTGKVLPKDGLLITDSGKKTDLNKKLFPLTKLQKNMEAEKFFVDIDY